MKSKIIVALALLAVLAARTVAADPKGDFEVHDLSLWVIDAHAELANARNLFPTAMPPQITSLRPRQTGATAGMAPLGVIRFYGHPAADVDVDLRIKDGTFLSNWPAADPGAGRLRWSGNPSELVEKLADLSSLQFVDVDHLFEKLREGTGLYLQRGARTERFLAYDGELKLGNVLRLQGGPDKYTIVNTSGETLHDVMIARLTPEGRRIAWLDELPKAVSPASSQTNTQLVPGGVLHANKIESNANLFSPPAKEKPTKEVPAKPVPGVPAVDKFAVPPDAAPAAPAAEKKKAAKPNLLTDFIGAVVKEKMKANAAEKKAPAAPADVKAEATTDAKPEQSVGLPNFPADKGGVEVTFSEPLAAGSPELAAKTVGELTARLERAGLKSEEASLFVGNYAKALFNSDALVVACRLNPAAIESKLPLSVLPEPTKTLRVALVIVRNADPQFGNDVERLVKELGDRKYKVREAAQSRLLELGPLAFPALNKGLSNTDLEIVMRCEKILVNQNQTPGATKNPAQPAQRVNGVAVPAPAAAR